MVAEGQRGGGVLEVILTLAQQAYEQRETLAPLLASLVAGLTTLGSWRRVKHIEISRGGEKLVIEDSDRAIVEQALTEFDEHMAGATGKTHVKAKVSKHARHR